MQTNAWHTALRIGVIYIYETPIITLLQLLIVLYRPDVADHQSRVKPVSLNLRDEYDFVVIGAGSAGSVIANRLSENENWSVLLVEAGPNEPEISDMPLATSILELSPLDWQFKIEPSVNYCQVLGGSSVLNAMYYIRGNKRDYENYTQATVRDGLRCSTAKAFLRSASKKRNLDLSVHSTVEKILINDDSKSAYGIQFRVDGISYKVAAKREVILSAGAKQSPQLLMLSGIGPEDHLRAVGMKTVHDAPGAGKNMQKYAFNLFESFTEKDVEEFALERTGQLYGLPTAEAVVFINSNYYSGKQVCWRIFMFSDGDWDIS
ncbi:glucose dehydrogenase [FAD, quinone]-like [Megalopta genalis]|uniref:glucose dehydrogenase [FAD, quinone]-like n=1 Tax=Megalopta genalis TaxID=115081 RepID=UPI003FD45F34